MDLNSNNVLLSCVHIYEVFYCTVFNCTGDFLSNASDMIYTFFSLFFFLGLFCIFSTISPFCFLMLWFPLPSLHQIINLSLHILGAFGKQWKLNILTWFRLFQWGKNEFRFKCKAFNVHRTHIISALSTSWRHITCLFYPILSFLLLKCDR